jgi:hypothetical protein
MSSALVKHQESAMISGQRPAVPQALVLHQSLRYSWPLVDETQLKYFLIDDPVGKNAAKKCLRAYHPPGRFQSIYSTVLP